MEKWICDGPDCDHKERCVYICQDGALDPYVLGCGEGCWRRKSVKALLAEPGDDDG